MIPANTKLTAWPEELKRWDTLSADEKKMFIRQADIFAAYAAYADHEIGRVIQAVEDLGKLDNTLIIYIEGDNGTSPEGTVIGTSAELTTAQGIPIALPDMLELYDDWGTDQTYPHMAVGWAWAFDTPFQWTKQVASHFGGTRQGMAISWPARIKDTGGIRTQFHHMIVTEGGRFGGYGLYLLKGKPVFVYNLMFVERFRWEGAEALSPGKHTIVFDFKSDGPGLGKGGTGTLSVDGTQVATLTIPSTAPFLFPWDETFDVGVDTRTPIDDSDYQVPFRLTGKVDNVIIKLGPVILKPEDAKTAEIMHHNLESSR